jgi:hypothetical protein
VAAHKGASLFGRRAHNGPIEVIKPSHKSMTTTYKIITLVMPQKTSRKKTAPCGICIYTTELEMRDFFGPYIEFNVHASSTGKNKYTRERVHYILNNSFPPGVNR